jgi:hypothetical protein
VTALKNAADLLRTHVYDIGTQYNALFPKDLPPAHLSASGAERGASFGGIAERVGEARGTCLRLAAGARRCMQKPATLAASGTLRYSGIMASHSSRSKSPNRQTPHAMLHTMRKSKCFGARTTCPEHSSNTSAAILRTSL